MNFHLLSHLCYYVERFGPLWTHSAFVFEDSIGHLVKLAHGTHDIANQVCVGSWSVSFSPEYHFHACCVMGWLTVAVQGYYGYFLIGVEMLSQKKDLFKCS